MTKQTKHYQKLLEHDCIGMDADSIRHSLSAHLSYSVAKDLRTVTTRDWYNALSYSVRDRMAERWMATHRIYHQEDVKRVYYLSLEFLTGRLLSNAMLNLGVYGACKQATNSLDLNLDNITEMEWDPALGNGGLGRLAACFLDSMASLRLPGYGYGIRYEFGMFSQRIKDGMQIEHPDNWLRYGNPWEFPRPEILYRVSFGGRVIDFTNEHGIPVSQWQPAEDVMAMAYDIPVPGYQVHTVNNLRLWAAKASRDFDLNYFNEGNYIKAVEDKNRSENLSKVLYPDDTTNMGKELRLRQEYFFVSASLQDIVRRFMISHRDIRKLPDKVAVQLNDTHPALAIPELMHILLDQHHLRWEEAWDITVQTFAYTNHTLLPEALETWPVPLIERLLPRHLQIIFEINHRFLNDVAHRFPGDMEMIRRMSLIGEAGEKQVRMSHLAVVGSHKVNGVAALHTELMKSTIFADFHTLFPGRIINKTNGITPRRWLNEANPRLARLITARIGNAWIGDLTELKKLEPLAQDPIFRKAFRQVKHDNKMHLAMYIQDKMGIEINPEAMFDVQVKRIHEYKRQLLNLLHVITHYNRICQHPEVERQPRVVIFAGKAAPGYSMAKLIIRLINHVADIINHDLRVGYKLKVVFIPNYDVTTAQRIIPAADLSEQISTAGTEASGTGNMKLALNGALTIGTLDGANIEIRDEVGAENFFLFGMTAAQVATLRSQGYNPWSFYHAHEELRQALDMIADGYFCPKQPDLFKPIINNLTHHGDSFMLLADYADYLRCQCEVDQVFTDQEEWTRRAIFNVANMGKFSSDRTIAEYAQEIWKINPVEVNLAIHCENTH